MQGVLGLVVVFGAHGVGWCRRAWHGRSHPPGTGRPGDTGLSNTTFENREAADVSQVTAVGVTQSTHVSVHTEKAAQAL